METILQICNNNNYELIVNLLEVFKQFWQACAKIPIYLFCNRSKREKQ